MSDPTKRPKKKYLTIKKADKAAESAVFEMLRLQEAARASYRTIDELETKLFAAFAEAGTERLLLSDGRVAAVKDNYADKNTAFKTCAFRAREITVS